MGALAQQHVMEHSFSLNILQSNNVHCAVIYFLMVGHRAEWLLCIALDWHQLLPAPVWLEPSCWIFFCFNAADIRLWEQLININVYHNNTLANYVSMLLYVVPFLVFWHAHVLLRVRCLTLSTLHSKIICGAGTTSHICMLLVSLPSALVLLIGYLLTFQTLLKSLHDSVDEEHAANYSLLMLWASLANAIPVSNNVQCCPYTMELSPLCMLHWLWGGIYTHWWMYFALTSLSTTTIAIISKLFC